MTVVKWDGIALGEPIKARLVLGDDHRVKIALSGLNLPCGDYLTSESIKELAELFVGLHIAAENLEAPSNSR